MTIEVVTYANKKFGLFDKLVNNEFESRDRSRHGNRVDRFSDKYRGMAKHLETKGDDDIVVFVDGFDTLINKDLAVRGKVPRHGRGNCRFRRP